MTINDLGRLESPITSTQREANERALGIDLDKLHTDLEVASAYLAEDRKEEAEYVIGECLKMLTRASLTHTAPQAAIPQVQDYKQWYDAVIDACIVAGELPWDENDARGTVAKLIAWHEEIALDPAVSERAAALAHQTAPQAASQQAGPTDSLYVAYGDDDAVDLFAKAMKEKMAASRAKGRSGWHDPDQCSAERLQTMLIDHLAKGDPVDIGNFAMMLWNRGEPVADVGRAFRNDGAEPDWSAYVESEADAATTASASSEVLTEEKFIELCKEAMGWNPVGEGLVACGVFFESIKPYLCAQAATTTEEEDISYEVMQDDQMVAGASGPGALAETLNYASQYVQDGPVEIVEVRRKVINRLEKP